MFRINKFIRATTYREQEKRGEYYTSCEEEETSCKEEVGSA
ncbi:unnamed protein product [Onchocerca flexuosa]|uniref:Uncharacterized protein n=1 Tax=Onchocerca flexuosa TaxID=387005 RepID=A0A183HVB9_9BILA|nr:unnamed protein product [Onchocerca flexuosa]